MSDTRLITLRLTTSHLQRLNSSSGKSLGIGRCEWLWSIATWSNHGRPSFRFRTIIHAIIFINPNIYSCFLWFSAISWINFEFLLWKNYCVSLSITSQKRFLRKLNNATSIRITDKIFLSKYLVNLPHVEQLSDSN